jgi:hypothetical protein
MTETGHGQIDEYLRVLRSAMSDVPPHRRDEIVTEIEAHIASRLAELPSAPSEADIRNILGQVGEPEDIAAEAREPREPQPGRRRLTDILALVLLPIPFIGWMVGGVLVWLSDVWSKRDKIIGTIAGPGTFAFFLLLTIAMPAGAGGAEEMASGPQPVGLKETSYALGPLELVALLLLLVAPLLAAIYLSSKLRAARTQAI